MSEQVNFRIDGKQKERFEEYMKKHGYTSKGAAASDLVDDALDVNGHENGLLDTWLFYLSASAALTGITFGVGQLATGLVPTTVSVAAMLIALVLLSLYAVRLASHVKLTIPRSARG